MEDALRRTNAELAVLFRGSTAASRPVTLSDLWAGIISTPTGPRILNLAPQGTRHLAADQLRLAYAESDHG